MMSYDVTEVTTRCLPLRVNVRRPAGAGRAAAVQAGLARPAGPAAVVGGRRADVPGPVFGGAEAPGCAAPSGPPRVPCWPPSPAAPRASAFSSVVCWRSPGTLPHACHADKFLGGEGQPPDPSAGGGPPYRPACERPCRLPCRRRTEPAETAAADTAADPAGGAGTAAGRACRTTEPDHADCARQLALTDSISG